MHNNGKASHVFVFIYTSKEHHASGEGSGLG
jgi:hypothetical protein